MTTVQTSAAAPALAHALPRAADVAAGYRTKRLLDVVLALALLLLLAPLMLAVAALIKLDSPGPVLFRQERVGARRRRRDQLRGWELRRFRVFKFRSMFSDADQSLHESHINDFVAGTIVSRDTEGRARFKIPGDPRITRVGKLLRRTSIDELPQLINVLRGEMSLVGPRPVPVYEAEHYLAAERIRFAALPGITGLWQVRGRCSLSCADMIRLDCEYVERRSLWLDLKILALTIPAVLFGKGAA